MNAHRTTSPETARRLFPLVGKLHEIAYSARVHEEFVPFGVRNYWDGYFAGRSAPMGRASAAAVDAVFYNFGPGEVARHIPYVWDLMTPEQALAARERGCVASLRERLGDLADSPDVARAGELLGRAAYSDGASTDGRALFAGLKVLPTPDEPLARLWHVATLLREHRGDGHNVALVTEGIGGVEAHFMLAIDWGMEEPEQFGRIWQHPKSYLAKVLGGLQDRGLVTADKKFTDEGRATKDRVEALTDRLAAPAYDVLSDAEVDELVTLLQPVVDLVEAG